jgi:hypothetical protein
MGKSSGTNTTTSTSQPPQQFLNAYSNLLGLGTTVASQPLQQYSGPLVAGFTPMQNQAFGTIQNAQGIADPYINAAAQYTSSGATPITPTAFSADQVNQYESPYTQQVVNATQAQFNNQNQQQQQQLIGNAISQGAFGGDRTAVAQAVLAGQQQLNQAPTIANLENQGYSQALGEFNTQQQTGVGAQEATGWLGENAGFGMGNLGNEALNSTLTGANAQLQAGALGQQLSQEQLNVPYEQFLQQQAYPFQTTSWLGNMVEGLGGSSGGTSSTTTPGPSTLGQIGGLGLTGLSAIGGSGGFGSNGWLTGLLGSGSSASLGDDALSGGLSLVNRGGRIKLPDHLLRGGHAAGGAGTPSVTESPGVSPPQNVPGFGLPSTSLPFWDVPLGMSPDTGTQPSAMPTTSIPTVPLASPSYMNRGGRAGFDVGGGVSQAVALTGQLMDALGADPQSRALTQDYSQLSPQKTQELSGNMFRGGRTGFDMGGVTSPTGTTQAGLLNSGFQQATGGDPVSQSLLQRYAQVPPEKLQELAVMMPPNSAQGQMIRRVLQAKRMNPAGAQQQQQQSGFAMAPQVAPAPQPTGAQIAPMFRGGRTGFDMGGVTPPAPLPTDQPTGSTWVGAPTGTSVNGIIGSTPGSRGINIPVIGQSDGATGGLTPTGQGGFNPSMNVSTNNYTAPPTSTLPFNTVPTTVSNYYKNLPAGQTQGTPGAGTTSSTSTTGVPGNGGAPGGSTSSGVNTPPATSFGSAVGQLGSLGGLSVSGLIAAALGLNSQVPSITQSAEAGLPGGMTSQEAATAIASNNAIANATNSPASNTPNDVGIDSAGNVSAVGGSPGGSSSPAPPPPSAPSAAGFGKGGSIHGRPGFDDGGSISDIMQANNPAYSDAPPDNQTPWWSPDLSRMRNMPYRPTGGFGFGITEDQAPWHPTSEASTRVPSSDVATVMRSHNPLASDNMNMADTNRTGVAGFTPLSAALTPQTSPSPGRSASEASTRNAATSGEKTVLVDSEDGATLPLETPSPQSIAKPKTAPAAAPTHGTPAAPAAAPTSPAPANSPAATNLDAEYPLPTRMPANHFDAPAIKATPQNFSTNPWAALGAAGLAMMASRSPHPLQAVGEGGLEGLKFAQQQQSEARGETQQANEAEWKKADAAARNRGYDVEAERLYDESLRHTEDVRRQAKQNEAQQTQWGHENELRGRQIDVELERAQQENAQITPGFGPGPDGASQVPGTWVIDKKNPANRQFMPGMIAGSGQNARAVTNEDLAQQMVTDGSAKDTNVARAMIADPSGHFAQQIDVARGRLAAQIQHNAQTATNPGAMSYPEAQRLAGATSAGPSAGAMPTPPKSLAGITGLQWNPKRQQWRDAGTGTLYDAQGNALKAQ